MDQREFPRVSVPLVIEATHLSFGKMVTTVRDASESGLFVVLEDPQLSSGARVKIRQLRLNSVDQHATPLVEAVVKRVEPHGVAVEFDSKAGAHLWHSVKRMREELAIGRDYFQVHQSAAVTDERGLLLIVQQQGLWSLPGHFLTVGDQPDEALASYFNEVFGLKLTINGLLTQSSEINPHAPEAAILRVVHRAEISDQTASLLPGSGYRSMRWLATANSAKDLSFSSPFDAQVVRQVFDAR